MTSMGTPRFTSRQIEAQLDSAAIDAASTRGNADADAVQGYDEALTMATDSIGKG